MDTQLETPAAEAADEISEAVPPAEAGETAPPSTQAAAAAQAPAGRTLEDILETGTPEEIRAALDAEMAENAGGEEGPEHEESESGTHETEEAQEPPAVEASEHPAEPADEVTAAETVAQITGKAPKRIKPAGTEADQKRLIAINDLLHKGRTLKQAVAELGLSAAQAAAAQQAPPAESAKAEQPSNPVESLQQQLAAARAEKEAAIADWNQDAHLAAERKIADLTDRIISAVQETAVEKALSRIEQQQQQAQLATRVEASAKQVLAAAPDFGDPDSALGQAANSIAESYHAQFPAFFNEPDWPEQLYVLAARKVGKLPIAPQTPQAAAPAKPAARPATPTPRKPGTPVSALATGNRGEATAFDSLAARVEANDPTLTQEEVEQWARQDAARNAPRRPGRR